MKLKERPVKKKPRTDARLRLMMALLTYFQIVGTPGIKEKGFGIGDELSRSS